LAVVAAAAAAFAALPASAAALTRQAIANGQANFDLNPAPALGVLFDDATTLQASREDGLDNHSIGLVEFDVSDLPGGVTILSASITIDVTQTNRHAPGTTAARAGVYDGVDGQITAADFLPAVGSDLAGSRNVDLRLFTIDLSPQVVQSITEAGTDFLGISLYVEPSGHSYRFGSLAGTLTQPAVLEIVYVPEPAGVVLMLVAIAGLVGWTEARRARTFRVRGPSSGLRPPSPSRTGEKE
jgi:hypothetical protein